MNETSGRSRARQALHGAEVLLEAEDYPASISRAYYAMFYAARAALEAEGLAPKTLSGLVNAFGQAFVQTGRLGTEAGCALRELSEARQLADYGEEEVFGREDAGRYLALARAFVETVEQLLRRP